MIFCCPPCSPVKLEGRTLVPVLAVYSTCILSCIQSEDQIFLCSYGLIVHLLYYFVPFFSCIQSNYQPISWHFVSNGMSWMGMIWTVTSFFHLWLSWVVLFCKKKVPYDFSSGLVHCHFVLCFKPLVCYTYYILLGLAAEYMFMGHIIYLILIHLVTSNIGNHIHGWDIWREKCSPKYPGAADLWAFAMYA
jgi:hypothetical protein